jgi:hypothetical protein
MRNVCPISTIRAHVPVPAEKGGCDVQDDLWATDGSEDADRALTYAKELAKAEDEIAAPRAGRDGCMCDGARGGRHNSPSRPPDFAISDRTAGRRPPRRPGVGFDRAYAASSVTAQLD